MRGTTRAMAAAMLATALLAGCAGETTAGRATTDEYATTAYDEGYVTDVQGTDEPGLANGADAPVAEAKSARDGDDGSGPAEQDEAKMVRSVSATVSAKDFDAASAEADRLMTEHKARVTTDDYDSDEDLSRRTRRISMRVASEEVDALVAQIKESRAWVVENVSVCATDMSDSYRDNETRVKTLRKRYDFYERKANEAKDEQVMVEMTDRMLQTLDQIEMLESQNRQTDLDVAWSTVSITMSYENTAEKLDTSEDVGQTLADAISMLPTNIAATFGRLLILVVALLPYLIMIGSITLVIVLCVKAHARRHPRPERPEPRPRPERTPRRERRAKPVAEREPAENLATQAGDEAEGAENADATDREGPKDGKS